jgi:Tfp pilus assembly protein PilO
MATARTRHAWLIGGAIGAVLLVALAWFVLIGPLHSGAASRYDEAEAARTRIPTLLSQLATLREQAQNPREYQERQTRARRALPATPASSNFLRELHAAGTATDVAVSDLLVNLTPEPTADPSVHSLPVTVTASGDMPDLLAFLDQLQTEQGRAVLIHSVDAVPGDGGATLDGTVSLTVDMRIFVGQPATPTAPVPPEAAGGN